MSGQTILPFMFVQVTARDAAGNTVSDETLPVIAQALNTWESYSKRLSFPDNATDFRVRFFIDRVEGPAKAAIANPKLRIVDESDDRQFDELSARITNESTARVAGDTALAQQINVLEAATVTLQGNIDGNTGEIDTTKALISTESQVRASEDAALALQIQQIIAEGAQGAQTFFQVDAPPNPEPGWLWFKDNPDPLSDELFRWSGTAWDAVDTSESIDVSDLRASITTETEARIAGDTALASRTTVLEASSVALRTDTNTNTVGLATANARVSDESAARVQGDNALATRTANLEAVVTNVGNSVTTVDARVTSESAARVAGDTALATRIDRIEAGGGTDLAPINARVDNESAARVAGDNALAARTTTVEANSVALRSDVNNLAIGANATNARVTEETTARVGGDNALAQRISTTEVTVGGVSSRVTVTEQAIGGLSARWGVRVDGGGRVSGIELNSGAGASFLGLLADYVRMYNPFNGADELVFEARDGRVFMKRAYIGDLTADQIRIDQNTISADGGGALTVTRNGITTPLIAPNAVAQIYAYSQTTGGTQFQRNVWSTIVLNGLQAGVFIQNDPAGTAFIRFDVSVLVRNFGSNSDVASFRIYRSDGFVLSGQYSGVHIDDTPNTAYGIQSMLFFDIGVPAGAGYAYYFQMNSNEESIIRTVNIMATLTKNSQAAPFIAPLLETAP